MPRYKVVCSCKNEFWVKRRHKLDEDAKRMLQSRRGVMCKECADILRARHQAVKAGIFVVSSPAEQPQIDSLIRRLRENEPFGFSRTPFAEYAQKQLDEDRASLAKGNTTRYRGYSPTYETLRLRYRVLAMEWAMQQVKEAA